MRREFRVSETKNVSISADIFVDEASTKASWLVQREARGPGDLPNAMRRLEARYGIPYSTFVLLRYRRPKDILISVYVRISEAHRAECERQKRLIEHEAYRADARTNFGRSVVAEAQALVRSDDETLNDD